jgi:hypothetical protein
MGTLFVTIKLISMKMKKHDSFSKCESDTERKADQRYYHKTCFNDNLRRDNTPLSYLSWPDLRESPMRPVATLILNPLILTLCLV